MKVKTFVCENCGKVENIIFNVVSEKKREICSLCAIRKNRFE